MKHQGAVAMLMKRADELDLTPEQRQQLGDLLEQQRASMRSSSDARAPPADARAGSRVNGQNN